MSCNSRQKHHEHECSCHKKKNHCNDDNRVRGDYYDHPWFRTAVTCHELKKHRCEWWGRN
ncbi:hypothetical protein [Oceanobacillus kapialis]|uniref:Uncharacterized protein n=1 Tax=Oceanobacillus kapialis TaxID=481353 RepID=A0ABW5Q2D6_9BACI